MISREEYAAERAALEAFLRLVRRSIAWIIAGSFLGYAVAGYLWWQGQPLWGLAVATTAYLCFRLYRRIALRVALRPGVIAGAARGLVERELAGPGGLEGVLEQIEALRRDAVIPPEQEA
jgi:hypothetical protein